MNKAAHRKKYWERHPDKLRESRARYSAKWRENNAHKIAAHHAVRAALANGTLVKPSKCERCPAPCEVAHHPDYGRPLFVIWLCDDCHNKEHGNISKNPERTR